MYVDKHWHLVPIPPKLDGDRLRALIADQARCCRANATHRAYAYVFPWPSEWAIEYGQEGSSTIRLTEALRVLWRRARRNRQPARSIIANDLLPPELRHAACRSFTADQIGGQLDAWRGYLASAAAGDLTAYLGRLHAHQEALALYRHWQSLAPAAARILAINAWKQKPGRRRLGELLIGAPPPRIPPAPVWACWERRHARELETQTELDIELTHGYGRELAALCADWNRIVAREWRIGFSYQPRPFEMFLDQTGDQELGETIEWLAASADDEHVLLFAESRYDSGEFDRKYFPSSY